MVPIVAAVSLTLYLSVCISHSVIQVSLLASLASCALDTIQPKQLQGGRQYNTISNI